MSEFEKAITATAQELDVHKDFFKFQTPNRLVISGPTCSGIGQRCGSVGSNHRSARSELQGGDRILGPGGWSGG